MSFAGKLNRLIGHFGLRLSRRRDEAEQRLRRFVLMHSWTGPSPRFEFDRPEYPVTDEDLELADRELFVRA